MTKKVLLALLLLVGCGGEDEPQNTTTTTATTTECIASDELCNGVDDDCDGLVDESDALDANTFYEDMDADGFGNPDSTILSCADTMDGYVVGENTDCDDTASDIHPGADEYCDSVDTDCSGTADDDYALDAMTWYADADNDGYGNPDESWTTCDTPAGWVADNTDCNDASNNSYPGATEFCDEEDNNCDGSIDEGVQTTYYLDDDNDGYGNADATKLACSVPSGYTSLDADCDDTDAFTHPGAYEYCNGIDNDCNGSEVSSGVGLNYNGGASWWDASSYFSTTAGIQSNGYSDEGDWFFCGNTTYFVNWEINDDVTVTGVNGIPTLHGGNVDSVIDINSNTVSLTNIQINNGYSSGNGGGIYQIAGVLNLVDVTFLYNQAEGNGGAIYLTSNAMMYADNIYLYLNTANELGGGVYAWDGEVEIHDSQFYYNLAGSYGGAIRGYENAQITLVDTSFFYNYADADYDNYGSGAAIALNGSSLIASGSGTGGYDCEFLANNDYAFGAVYLDSSTADFSDCNFNVDGSVYDNFLYDISTAGLGYNYEYEANTSVSCDGDGCGSVVSEYTGISYADFNNTTTASSYLIGHVIQSTGTRTIDYFELWMGAGSACSPTYYVYESLNKTDWFEIWSGVGDPITSTTHHSSGNVGLPTKNGYYYALVGHYDSSVCTTITYYYSSYSQPVDISFGTFEDYIFDSNWEPDQGISTWGSAYTFWGRVQSSH